VLASTSITGAINVSGSTVDIGLGTASATLDGTVTSLVQTYADGSTFTVSSPLAAVSGLVLDDRILLDSAYNSGDDTISVTMANLSSAYVANGGDGNDRITITGSGSLLSASGGNGNDTFVLGDHGHTLVGGAGVDSAVFSGTRASYAVTASTTIAGNSTVMTSGGALDTLAGIERLQFDNAYVALDIAGNAGVTYRLYQAAFNRTPDLAGLGYWIKQMDNGMSLLDMARNFTHSQEFQALYGVHPSNTELVTNFYLNTLHRDPEPAGHAYWLDVLDRNLLTTAEMLCFFSEGAENQAAVQPAILTGIAYTPYN
jgi:Ca2+-binding RTX toxin-like protein